MATDPNTFKSYNANAEQYHAHVTDPADSTLHSLYEKPAIRAELPNLNGLEVISIGCGSGVDARWIADNGAKSVVGIDISDKLLDIAKKENPDIDFQEMNMEHLDFPDDSFDLAYSSLAIHYVDDWTQPQSEAYRVLRQGGKYIFSCSHPIDSAMEYSTEGDVKYVRLGRKANKLTNEREVFGNYLVPESDGVAPIKGVMGGAVEVVFYHRTFSKMLEQIHASGFKIERLVEPQPVEGDPDHYEQLTKIPSFMIWVLRKS